MSEQRAAEPAGEENEAVNPSRPPAEGGREEVEGALGDQEVEAGREGSAS